MVHNVLSALAKIVSAVLDNLPEPHSEIEIKPEPAVSISIKSVGEMVNVGFMNDTEKHEVTTYKGKDSKGKDITGVEKKITLKPSGLQPKGAKEWNMFFVIHSLTTLVWNDTPNTSITFDCHSPSSDSSLNTRGFFGLPGHNNISGTVSSATGTYKNMVGALVNFNDDGEGNTQVIFTRSEYPTYK